MRPRLPPLPGPLLLACAAHALLRYPEQTQEPRCPCPICAPPLCQGDDIAPTRSSASQGVPATACGHYVPRMLPPQAPLDPVEPVSCSNKIRVRSPSIAGHPRDPVGTPPRLCDVLKVLRVERDQCLQELSRESAEHPAPGCRGLWDNTSCWPSSALGQTVEVACPRFLWMLVGRNGSMFRNCTQGGWSETFPRPDLACGVNVNDSSNEKRYEYLLKLKVMYTVGYSSSLVMLLVALSILCAFRRLHCTRNYIHMHLFVSFILRALSNFIKDAVLFSSDDATHCDAHRVGCKLVMVFFQYCIMANYSWLLVEGLYLHTLLVISFFSEQKWLQGFVALGWGSPAIFVASWAVTRHFLEDVGCWDINANASIWWVIRGPVILSILINFILFINILRILMRKLRTQETRGNEVNHYKRLAKSTLLLIPLFGIHYIIFAFSPEDAMEVQLFFELALGSFQGLVVAILYCFLNGEVQLEVQKKWRQWHLRELPSRPVAPSSSSSSGIKASPSEQSRATRRTSVI